MIHRIAEIEAHSLSAIPALRTEIYDGWHLRFARNHTRRANSVNVVSRGELPIQEKIDYCEAAYAKERQPSHFRLTPLADDGLDPLLAERNYGLFGETEVRVQTIDDSYSSDSGSDLVTYDANSEFWMKGVAALTGQNTAQQAVFREMLSLIQLDIQAIAILRGKEIVACGMGVQSKDYLGLFEFATHPNFRRRGFAARIARHMLQCAKNAGIARAYLQVVTENRSGRDFWSRVGFREVLYHYHYRSKL
ncbi:GNAT family N-acetyltransferase [Sneathiella sp. CAU 1612]|uniref:GNAT family N-acetyltransferase n=1 Tax=Sneathiella sedimenti TaxID=2816034 RepID=A0ABS3F6L2_9PROT|nr:GNAT family N-acetyltransferase [Sneathiella sedimenti]MBO0334161.1 GNAT family N-acetyltransferase [Sneathiella sedimenti]